MKPAKLAVIAVLMGLSSLVVAQTNPPKPAKVRVSSGVAEGLRTHFVAPAYPVKARMQGAEGDVVLHATIDRTGKISDLKLVQDDPVLAEAAIDAVKQWKYRPTC